MSSITVNIANNIILGNMFFGVYLPGASPVISRNNFYNNVGPTSQNCPNNDYCPFTPTVADNLWGDPLLFGENSILQPSSPCRNQGQNSPAALNPDGSRNDIGAYGGPGATSFWPYGFGPIVTNITSSPMRVEQNGTITINATAQTR
jgi:hypothetical protein